MLQQNNTNVRVPDNIFFENPEIFFLSEGKKVFFFIF